MKEVLSNILDRSNKNVTYAERLREFLAAQSLEKVVFILISDRTNKNLNRHLLGARKVRMEQ